MLGELSTDFRLFCTKIKLKYDDLENIKTDRVNTVVFNLHEIKQVKVFFGGNPVLNNPSLKWLCRLTLIYQNANQSAQLLQGWYRDMVSPA